MPKDQIDDLIAAVEAVEFLKDAVANQKKSITAILDELDRLRTRITALEAKPLPQKS